MLANPASRPWSLLRPLFRRRRELLRDLAQSSAEALCTLVCESLGEGLRPGVVVSIATSGDGWDAHEIMRLFRERLLARLVARHAISQELADKLRSWRHPEDPGSRRAQPT